jgi:hypothetical protein
MTEGSTAKPLPRIRTDEERAAHDAALLATGEPLATKRELWRLIPGLTRPLLDRFTGAWRRDHDDPLTVRYVASSRPVLFCVSDVRRAFEADAPRREQWAAKRRAAHLAREAADRAAAHVRKEAKLAAKTPAPAPTAPKAKRRIVSSAPVVEVIVRRGRP